jgi:hypothetical protein
MSVGVMSTRRGKIGEDQLPERGGDRVAEGAEHPGLLQHQPQEARLAGAPMSLSTARSWVFSRVRLYITIITMTAAVSVRITVKSPICSRARWTTPPSRSASSSAWL